MKKIIALALALISLFSLATPVCANADGIGDSMADLGFAFLYGEGVETDYEKAFEYFTEADRYGSTRVQFTLGEMYEYGMGMEKDLVEAVKWYLAAAEAGVPEAQDKLNTEPLKSIARAMSVQIQATHSSTVDEKPASAEDTATFRSGEASDDADNRTAEVGSTFPTVGNNVQTLEYYLAAEKQGDTSVLFPLGEMYEYGTGVDKDVIEAVKWYLKAAEAGNDEAKKKLEVEPMKSIAEAMSVQNQATHVNTTTGETVYIPRRGPATPMMTEKPLVDAESVTLVITIDVKRGIRPDDWYLYVLGVDGQWQHVSAFEISKEQDNGETMVYHLKLNGKRTFTGITICPVYGGMDFSARFDILLFASENDIGEYGPDIPRPVFTPSGDAAMSVSMRPGSMTPTNILGYASGEKVDG